MKTFTNAAGTLKCITT